MLFQLLKSVKRWASRSFQATSDAEDRFVRSMIKEEQDEGN
jgi:hypothetical protein